MPWGIHDIPPQHGRLAVITGATGGLGLETALALAGAGAEVILTGRSQAKGEAALARLHGLHPHARACYRHLDLASLATIRAFADDFIRTHGKLDLLINNAGVMMPPQRSETADGFELQFGSNYLGHYALTAQLLPPLRAAGRARVISLSSIAHRLGGRLHFNDLQWRRHYRPWPAYAQSKLAMLMFALELQRRSDMHDWGVLSAACHPGYARTALFDTAAAGNGMVNRIKHGLRALVEPLASQSAAEGALPILYAATAADVQRGAYYGPRYLALKGPVSKARIARQARVPEDAARLWDLSAQLTAQGVG